ncbi:MAG TPA: hypothetical protein VIH75_00620 [Candidatus Sulfotelmatobacter sp.]|jgi:hypothetical protein
MQPAVVGVVHEVGVSGLNTVSRLRRQRGSERLIPLDDISPGGKPNLGVPTQLQQ